MSTRVNYNGVQMFNVVTRRWDQDVIYDDSGTDAIASRFSLEFEGIIHTQSGDNTPTTFVGLPNAPQSGSPHAIYQLVAAALNQPRKQLRVYFGNNVVLAALPAAEANGTAMDVGNGPKPRSVNLVRIHGAYAFTVRFAIDCDLILCRDFPYPPSDVNRLVLSNRWRVMETLDANFFTTRTIEGRMKIARGVTTPDRGDPGHLFRPLVVPPLENGFRRDRIEFAVEADNVTCTYNVTDRQVHTAAPHPAVRMDVTHTESTGDGQTFYSTINVKLEGSPSSDKREMLARMIEIADKKISVTNVDNVYIENLEIIDHTGEQNTVEANFRVRHVQNDSREAITKLQVDTWGKPLDLDIIPVETDDPDDRKGVPYSPVENPIPYIYGYGTQAGLRNTAMLFLAHCYLQDPCGTTPHNIAQFDQETLLTNLPENQRDTTNVIERSPGELNQSPLESLSGETTSVGMYTFSAIRNRYVSQRMRVQMPIARQTSNSGATAVFFDLSEPQMYRVIHVDMERLGSPPRLPLPVDSYRFGSGDRGLAVLKDHEIHPSAPILSPDSSQLIYRASATYWYMMDRPLQLDELARIERHPLISRDFVSEEKRLQDYYATA